jgi:hypothetical protein
MKLKAFLFSIAYTSMCVGVLILARHESTIQPVGPSRRCNGFYTVDHFNSWRPSSRFITTDQIKRINT